MFTSSSPTMEISLHKANKLRTQLKALAGQSRIKELKSVVQVDYSQTNPVTLDQFKAQINDTTQEAKEQIYRHFRLNRDLRTLKDLIFTANVSSGVSALLSQIETLEMEKRVFESLKKSLESATAGGYYGGGLTVDVDASYASLTKERENQYHYNNHVRCGVYDKAELDARISAINKQVSQLEDNRDRLNSTTKVNLDKLDRKTLEELGL